MQNAECKMGGKGFNKEEVIFRHFKCKMQRAKCKMAADISEMKKRYTATLNAEGKMQNAKWAGKASIKKK
ncbi:MAG: hypothetical protein IKK60_05775 [Clostridia bacterium]|nr:hypothetical protein [Clostridia bacterium]